MIDVRSKRMMLSALSIFKLRLKEIWLHPNGNILGNKMEKTA